MKIHCFFNCSYWTADQQKMEVHYYQKHYSSAEITIEDFKLDLKEIKRLEKQIKHHETKK